jgi:uncharacterized protein YggE
MFRLLKLSLLAGLLPASLALAASAGPAGPAGSISGSGTARLIQQPDTLRLQVELSAEGKELKDALANLRKLQGSIRPQLVSLGAAEESISMGDARIQQAADQRGQMEQMMRARMGGARKPAAKPQTPPVTVLASLTAEWPLKEADPDQTLIFASGVRAKVTALVSRTARPLTPEEQERMEEEAGMMMSGIDDEPRPGEPVFLYVKKVSPEARAKAMAEAFADAREQARHLAAAAGVQLGPVQHLSASVTPDYSQYQSDNPYTQRMMYSIMRGAAQEASTDEAIAANPGAVVLLVTVRAAFQPQ